MGSSADPPPSPIPEQPSSVAWVAFGCVPCGFLFPRSAEPSPGCPRQTKNSAYLDVSQCEAGSSEPEGNFCAVQRGPCARRLLRASRSTGLLRLSKHAQHACSHVFPQPHAEQRHAHATCRYMQPQTTWAGVHTQENLHARTHTQPQTSMLSSLQARAGQEGPL